jgi:hypothetical protein
VDGGAYFFKKSLAKMQHSPKITAVMVKSFLSVDYPGSTRGLGVSKANKEKTKEKIVAPTAPAVKIVANVDIGAENKLYIRGSGAGLSWEKGSAMRRGKAGWTWQGKSGESFEYKFLINDKIWNVGENYSADIAQENTVTPTFE